MARLYCLLVAKPLGNLALRVFQRYYGDLSQALSSCPEEAAAILYSNELLTMQERSQAVDTLGLTPFRKAEILVQAIERRIVAGNGAAPLRKFCRVLRTRRGVGSVVSRMKFRLGERTRWPYFIVVWPTVFFVIKRCATGTLVISSYYC